MWIAIIIMYFILLRTMVLLGKWFTTRGVMGLLFGSNARYYYDGSRLVFDKKNVSISNEDNDGFNFTINPDLAVKGMLDSHVTNGD